MGVGPRQGVGSNTEFLAERVELVAGALFAPARLLVAVQVGALLGQDQFRPGAFRLSPASVHTLSLQGGPMSEVEVAEFESSPYHRDAIAVRRWDDEAKDPDADTPDYAVFAPILARLLK